MLDFLSIIVYLLVVYFISPALLLNLNMRQYSNIAFKFVAALVALNYFAFRVELFDDEYEQNHPNHASVLTISLPSLNWESFDKDNAQQAFIVDAEITNLCLFILPNKFEAQPDAFFPFSLIRDKSPPLRTVESIL